jgi:hypothetical protein
MKPTFQFERLEVWEDARRITRSIYGLAHSLPRTEELLYLGVDESYFKPADVDACLSEIDTVSAKLVMLNRSLRVNISKTPFNRKPVLAPRPSTLDTRL